MSVRSRLEKLEADSVTNTFSELIVVGVGEAPPEDGFVHITLSDDDSYYRDGYRPKKTPSSK